MSPVESTLAALVAFPTVSSRPVEAIAAYLADRCSSAGMRVERFETSPGKCNVVASAGPVGTDGLVISGHMDVVPVEGQPWTSDPFVLTPRGISPEAGIITSFSSLRTSSFSATLVRDFVS